jgi:hypothetical protein
MTVDGRLAMANVDHQRQGKKITFHDPRVLSDADDHVTLMVVVESEVYGRRHGIATSRKADGSSIETQHPWEIAETSAIGRALASMGYGLLPGSEAYESLNQSADEAQGGRDGAGPAETLSVRQRDFLINAAAEALALSAQDAARYVNRLCRERYGHSLSECSRDEGRALAEELRRPSTSTGTTEEAASAPPAQQSA